MSVRSSFVTCTNDGSMRGFIIPSLPSTVSTDVLVVDDKADKLYQQMDSDYKAVIKEFESLADLYSGASKASTGKMKKAYLKVSKRCKEQSEYCRKRLKQLNNSYEYSSIEGKLGTLESALIKDGGVVDSGSSASVSNM